MIHLRIGVTSLAVIVTFTFHYPRNDLMFVGPLADIPPGELEAAARQWRLGNYVRVALLAGAVAAAPRGQVQSACSELSRSSS
jgi:hypothetical protein